MKKMKMNKYGMSLGLAAICALSAFGAAAADLPSKVCLSVAASPPEFGTPSYCLATLQLPGGAKIFDAWCAQPNVPISGEIIYTAEVLTPAVAGAQGLVAYPENFDLVAYILNQNYPGKPSPSGGFYTSGDVQVVIWWLLEGSLGSGQGPWNPDRGNEIIAAAEANGEGFVPGCNDNGIMVLKPVAEVCDLGTTLTEPVAQALIIQVPGPCSGPGTGTPGYWMNHPEAWPVEAITIGNTTYTKADAIAGIKLAVRGDKRWTIFAALVCAKLNVIIGNESNCIANTITQADAWWVQYGGASVKGSSTAWKLGEPLYLNLDAYNNGLLCAPHRD